jgi:hypothetical protein
MAINFPSLEADDRAQILTNILDMNGGLLSEGDISYLSNAYDVNGRQIKNAVRNATALAKRDNRVADVDDFALILDKGIEFQEAVFAQGATSDMRLTGMHHDSGTDYDDDTSAALEVNVLPYSFFTRICQGAASFFNILGGGKI